MDSICGGYMSHHLLPGIISYKKKIFFKKRKKERKRKKTLVWLVCSKIVLCGASSIEAPLKF